jgi:hypothetical protein
MSEGLQLRDTKTHFDQPITLPLANFFLCFCVMAQLPPLASHFRQHLAGCQLALSSPASDFVAEVTTVTVQHLFVALPQTPLSSPLQLPSQPFPSFSPTTSSNVLLHENTLPPATSSRLSTEHILLPVPPITSTTLPNDGLSTEFIPSNGQQLVPFSEAPTFNHLQQCEFEESQHHNENNLDIEERAHKRRRIISQPTVSLVCPTKEKFAFHHRAFVPFVIKDADKPFSFTKILIVNEKSTDLLSMCKFLGLGANDAFYRLFGLSQVIHSFTHSPFTSHSLNFLRPSTG